MVSGWLFAVIYLSLVAVNSLCLLGKEISLVGSCAYLSTNTYTYVKAGNAVLQCRDMGECCGEERGLTECRMGVGETLGRCMQIERYGW